MTWAGSLLPLGPSCHWRVDLGLLLARPGLGAGVVGVVGSFRIKLVWVTSRYKSSARFTRLVTTTSHWTFGICSMSPPHNNCSSGYITCRCFVLASTFCSPINPFGRGASSKRSGLMGTPWATLALWGSAWGSAHQASHQGNSLTLLSALFPIQAPRHPHTHPLEPTREGDSTNSCLPWRAAMA